MAMIGRGAAIAEVGKNHHEVHGQLAHMAWLGVHASLMTGTRDKIEAIIDWGWDRFSKTGGPHVLDRGEAAEIDWDDDPVAARAASDARLYRASGSRAGPAASEHRHRVQRRAGAVDDPQRRRGEQKLPAPGPLADDRAHPRTAGSRAGARPSR